MKYINGFTLIELSIAMVVIGLLVGGVLVGRDMIRAGELRATVGQLDKYNTAVRTFQIRYNAIPGDMTPDLATAFGLFTLGGLGANGNGLLSDFYAYDDLCPLTNTSQINNYNNPAGEIAAFWRHLSEAKLIDGSYGMVGDEALDSTTCRPTCTTPFVLNHIHQLIPVSKLGGGVNITVASNQNNNYYVLLPIAGWDDCAASNFWRIGESGITPIEAHKIDSKIDDGNPESGTVIALGLAGLTGSAGGSDAASLGSTPPTSAGVATSGKCVVGTGTAITDTYNLSINAGGNDRSCGLAVRFQ